MSKYQKDILLNIHEQLAQVSSRLDKTGNTLTTLARKIGQDKNQGGVETSPSVSKKFVECSLNCTPLSDKMKVSNSMLRKEELLQKQHPFVTRFIVQNKVCSVGFDKENRTNIISSILVEDLKLPTITCPTTDVRSSSNEVKRQVLVSVNLGRYNDEILCDVEPIQTCHILLGKTWHDDRSARLDEQKNRYYLKKGDRKIIFAPLTPDQTQEDQLRLQSEVKAHLIKCEERKEKEKRERELKEKRENDEKNEKKKKEKEKKFAIEKGETREKEETREEKEKKREKSEKEKRENEREKNQKNNESLTLFSSVKRNIMEDQSICLFPFKKNSSHCFNRNIPSSTIFFVQGFKDIIPTSIPLDLPTELEFGFRAKKSEVVISINLLYHEKTIEVRQPIARMLEISEVREVLNCCAMPSIVVPSKEESWQVYIDYQVVNNSTVKYCHSNFHLGNKFYKLHDSYVTNLKGVYHRNRIKTKDELIITFDSRNILYRSIAMIFQFNYAPNILRKLINPNSCASFQSVVHFGELHIGSKYITIYLRIVLLRLNNRQMRVEFESYFSCINEIKTFGYKISTRMNDRNIEVGHKCPKYCHDLHVLHFCELVYLNRRFYRDFTILIILLREHVKFCWSQEKKNTSDGFHDTVSILALLEFSNTIPSEINPSVASGFCVEIVFMRGRTLFIYFGKGFYESKMNIPIYDDELYGLIWIPYTSHQFLKAKQFLKYSIKSGKLNAQRWLEIELFFNKRLQGNKSVICNTMSWRYVFLTTLCIRLLRLHINLLKSCFDKQYIHKNCYFERIQARKKIRKLIKILSKNIWDFRTIKVKYRNSSDLLGPDLCFLIFTDSRTNHFEERGSDANHGDMIHRGNEINMIQGVISIKTNGIFIISGFLNY